MTTKIVIGFSQKLGRPDFGSIGATCQMDLDVGDTDISSSAFRSRVRSVYDACRKAVQYELDIENHRCERKATAEDRSKVAVQQPNGHRMASNAQIKAIQVIAGKQRIDLSELLTRQYEVSLPEQLNIRQASQLIDKLKSQLMQH